MTIIVDDKYSIISNILKYAHTTYNLITKLEMSNYSVITVSN